MIIIIVETSNAMTLYKFFFSTSPKLFASFDDMIVRVDS